MMMNNFQPDYGGNANQIPIFGQIWVNGLRGRPFPHAHICTYRTAYLLI